MKNTYAYLENHQTDIQRDLERLVLAESPSNRKDLVDTCGQTLQALFRERLGVATEVIPEADYGNHLRFEVGQGDEALLVLGHFDTVWEPGRLSLRQEGERLYGPGIFDMKAGLIIALWGVKALLHSAPRLQHRLVFLCTSDEELGSPSSRPLIEAQARKSQAVLVMEPAEADTGALKTGRKGILIYRLRVHGVAAHAGNHHEEGVNAVWEMAKHIDALQNLTNYKLGTTVNVGIVHGGTRDNVVPAYAEAEIDIRVATMAEARRMEDVFRNLQPYLPGASLEVSGGLNRPPMERTPATVALFQKAQAAAAELGLSLCEATVGGGSDGNFTAGLGVPTLDGLGARGDGPHAEHEHILIPSLVERAALFAGLVQQLEASQGGISEA
ncbi:MAG: M20 family metallopeptidase [Alicyclobacillus herbarius]|uniref:M20 family metallopeptidase n=1 Tax=Alicyclobacillus herbarius TaxID=122960 RepID=UPI00235532F0|nr:M20 family metallopeptidase [Alicyclobacillus herbarius]MCL6632559.1 M20 family metallopeptidase [Alicyclobacillus herbarius]